MCDRWYFSRCGAAGSIIVPPPFFWCTRRLREPFTERTMIARLRKSILKDLRNRTYAVAAVVSYPREKENM
jgi:hypothetical protein